jgi:hypothetical protein
MRPFLLFLLFFAATSAHSQLRPDITGATTIFAEEGTAVASGKCQERFPLKSEGWKDVHRKWRSQHEARLSALSTSLAVILGPPSEMQNQPRNEKDLELLALRMQSLSWPLYALAGARDAQAEAICTQIHAVLQHTDSQDKLLARAQLALEAYAKSPAK